MRYVATCKAVTPDKGPLWPVAYGETKKQAINALNERLDIDFYDCYIGKISCTEVGEPIK